MIFWFLSGAMALVVGGFQRGPRGAVRIRPSPHRRIMISRSTATNWTRWSVTSPAVWCLRPMPSGSNRDLAPDPRRRCWARHSCAKHVAARAARADRGIIALGAGSLALYWHLGQPGYGDLALADRIAFAEDMRRNRPSQQSAVESLPASPSTEGLSADYLALIQQLRATVKERPEDLQGQTLLAQNEARIGNFAAAAEAQGNVLRLKGANRTAKDIADYAELWFSRRGLCLSRGGNRPAGSAQPR